MYILSIFFKCCAICGSTGFWGLNEECPDCGNKEPLPENEMNQKHKILHITTKPIYYYSQHKIQFYKEQSIQKYGTDEEWYEVFITTELSNQPLFNYALYEKSKQRENEYFKRQRELGNNDVDRESYLMRMQGPGNKPSTLKNTPECPTCHSTDVKRISDARKVAGALMFGLFSKTAKSQFQCNNCGYKW